MTALENLVSDIKFRIECIQHEIDALIARQDELQSWKMDIESRADKEKQETKL